MQYLSMCRICLVTDVRLRSLASHLRDMYERITAMTFKREETSPLVVCYICHARLQNCYRLRMSCLQSEEQFTEMMSSGVLTPQDELITNTFRVVSVLHVSMGHAVLDRTECHVKEEAPEIICDAELNQHNIEDVVTDTQGEQYKVMDENIQCSHLDDPLYIMKQEPNDVKTDVQDIKLDIEDTSLEVNDPNGVGLSSQLANNLCPKIVKVVLQRIDDTGRGARVLKNTKIVDVEDTEDATTNKIKTEGNEAKMITKKIEFHKPVRSKLLESCDKLDIKLNTCNNIESTKKENSTNNRSLKHNMTRISVSKYKQFSCDTCKKCFSCKKILINHIRTHTGEKPYQCYGCNQCFSSQDSLLRHNRTHTGEKPYQCTVCNKCFSNPSNLLQHNRTHTGEKPYRCNVCNKCFTEKGSLIKHNRTHTGEKPYQCNSCSKCFSSHFSLLRHNRTHTGEKPYQCNVCKKCFREKGSLLRHSRTHTGEKPYQCNVCNKCFSYQSNLLQHKRTHTGVKPYQCNVCNKCFTVKGSLKTHNRIHTGKNHVNEMVLANDSVIVVVY